jgi:hypothetical protein
MMRKKSLFRFCCEIHAVGLQAGLFGVSGTHVPKSTLRSGSQKAHFRHSSMNFTTEPNKFHPPRE